ncbi:MAG: Crp/Fnr family transcriptional regulator [Acidobacteriota bacterium]
MTHLLEDQALTPEILKTYPGFEPASDDVLADVLQAGIRLSIPAARVMCSQGEKCQGFPLVLRGRARVHTVGENGRDITLYRLLPGDTCMLAISCVLSGRLSPAYTVAETDGEVMLVPGEIFSHWFVQKAFWREFVFARLADCLVDVIQVTNDAIFRRLDTRIASYLLNAPGKFGTTLKTTHQDIASEVGSSREVVSRMLKVFEKDGLLTLGRGSIHLQDREGLVSRAQSID